VPRAAPVKCGDFNQSVQGPTSIRQDQRDRRRRESPGDITWCRLDAAVPEAVLLSSATCCVPERLHDALDAAVS
jgi:hypothetical protein